MNDNFDQELDQMDDFEFKPITKGLGFHHSISEKSKVETDLKSQQKSLQEDLKRNTERILNKIPSPSVEKKHVEHMGELAAFYNPTAIDTKNIAPLVKEEEVEVLADASMGIRLMAWLVDVAVVTFMFITAIVSIFMVADMPFDSLSPLFFTSDIGTNFVVLFMMFYVFYFSFLDKTEFSTLGKRLFDIKLISMTSAPSFLNTTLRTILTFVSVLTLGLFSMLSLQDSLTNTKVIKRRHV